MLEQYYDCERTMWRLTHCGAFGALVEEFLAYLRKRVASRYTIREYLRAAAHMSRFALWEGLTNLCDLDEAFAVRFVNEHLPTCSCERINKGQYLSTITGVWYTIRFLADKGIIPDVEPMLPGSLIPMTHAIAKAAALPPKEGKLPRTDAASEALLRQKLPDTAGGLLVRYNAYLADMFGLSKKSQDIHRAKTLAFMKWVFEKHGKGFSLSNLTADDIIGFQETCNSYGYSNDYRKTITGCLRGFLRFLRWEYILEKDLTPAVYKVKKWKLATVPKFVPYDVAELLLTAPDKNTFKGKRDYVVLLLFLRLGLRANEVVQMYLNDLSFERGVISVRKTKTAKDRELPMTNELAEAIMDYLIARPNWVEDNHLILRSVYPFKQLTASSALGCMVRGYIESLGLKTPTYGTHLLRHTYATKLANEGVSFKEIGDLLGHEHIESTSIYAKVQTDRLRKIALPFPCAEEE